MCKKLVCFMSIAFILFMSTGALCAEGVWEGLIQDENDDVEEDINPSKLGEIDAGSSDLELAYEDTGQGDPQFGGVRFIGVAVPPNHAVTNAWVRFQVDETKGGTQPVNLLIHGELSPNPSRFTGGGQEPLIFPIEPKRLPV
mgnify:CR=1 FL=1